MARKRADTEPAVDVDIAAGELFEQRRFCVVKLKMSDGSWETQLDNATEDEAVAYIADQRNRRPSIPLDDWGVFAAETTRIELRLS